MTATRSMVSSAADTVADVSARLRALAVELVRAGNASDASAVLSAVGAIEMLSVFAEDTLESKSLVRLE